MSSRFLALMFLLAGVGGVLVGVGFLVPAPFTVLLAGGFCLVAGIDLARDDEDKL